MRFKIYEDQAGLFRWSLVARNGKIIADSGEGYQTRQNAQRAIDRLIDIIERGFLGR